MNRILILVLFFIVQSVLNAQTTFNKIYSPNGNNINTPLGAYSIVKNNNNYIINTIGFDTVNINYQSLNFYKIDSIGTTNQLFNFSKAGYHYYQTHIKKAKGSGFYAIGIIDSINSIEELTHFIIRFNQNMDTLWIKYIPAQDTIFEAYRNFCETSDKNLVFVGDRYANPSNSNIMIKKTDSLGNQLWRKLIPIAYLGEGWDIIETPDKGFLINGYNNSYTYEQGDCLLIKTDSMGNQQWIKYLDINNNQYDGGGAMALTNDGNILYAYGNSYQTNPFNESYKARLKIIKYTLNGNLIWEKFYDKIRAELNVRKIQIFPNNDFILMGSNSERDSFSFFPSYLFKFNSNGDSLWRKIYYFSDIYGDLNLLADNVLNEDGSIMLCGYVIGDTLSPHSQIWLLKTDSTGYASGPQNVSIIDLPYLQLGYGGMRVYPNPANEFVVISYEINKAINGLRLVICNSLGKTVYDKELNKAKDELLITLKDYAKGNYVVTLFNNGKVVNSSKMVIQ